MHHSGTTVRAPLYLIIFDTALNYKPRILDPAMKEFSCLVHKLFVTLTAQQCKPQ